MDPDKTEAVQNVVERVSSYQESAPEGTVEQEIRAGLADAGVELGDDEITKLAEAVERDGGDVDAAQVLG